MKQRDFGLDLTRCAAAVLVLAVHFFLNNGFYSEPLAGAGMAVSAVLRMAFMTCVPLFMVLSGYLCTNRRWSRGYLRGLLPVVLTYLLAACVCLAFRIGYMGQSFSLGGLARSVLDFSAAPYGWYVEMYIGLFLLMPFVNAAWNGLEERGKGALVLVLVSMTALPAFVNQWRQLLPDWWTGIYPLTYYVVGAWLREHPLRWKKRWLLLGWLGLAAVFGAAQYVHQNFAMPGQPFQVVEGNYWASLVTMAETVCLFSLLTQVEGKHCPKPVRRIVSRTAKLSLPIYLMSYITDQIIYPPLCAAVPTAAQRLPFLPLMVAVSLLLSGAMAQCVDWAVKALMRLVPKRESAKV